MEIKKLKWEQPILRGLGGIGELTQGGGCEPYGGSYGVTEYCTGTRNLASTTCTSNGTSAGGACTTVGDGY